MPRPEMDLAGFAARGCIANDISTCAVFDFECLARGAACGAAASSAKTLLNGQRIGKCGAVAAWNRVRKGSSVRAQSAPRKCMILCRPRPKKDADSTAAEAVPESAPSATVHADLMSRAVPS